MTPPQIPYKHLLNSLSPERASLVRVVWNCRVEFYRCLDAIDSVSQYVVSESNLPEPMED